MASIKPTTTKYAMQRRGGHLFKRLSLKQKKHWSNVNIPEIEFLYSSKLQHLADKNLSGLGANTYKQHQKHIQLPPFPTIKNITVAKRFFTYKYEGKDNEVLEFLGDAYIDLLVDVLIYNKFPNLQTKMMTDILLEVVNNKNLSKWALLCGTKRNNVKHNADQFEAYFEGLSFENSLSSNLGNFTNQLCQGWN